MNLHLEDEDYQDALDIVHKAMDLDTQDVTDCSAKIVPKTEVPDVIVEHDSNRQRNQDNIVHLPEDPTGIYVLSGKQLNFIKLIQIKLL